MKYMETRDKATAIIQKTTLIFTSFKTSSLAPRILGVEEEPSSELLVFPYQFTRYYPKRSFEDEFNWGIVIIGDWCLKTKLSYPINGLIKVALHFTIHFISGSQGIHRYISVMAALKFTFLIKR